MGTAKQRWLTRHLKPRLKAVELYLRCLVHLHNVHKDSLTFTLPNFTLTCAIIVRSSLMFKSQPILPFISFLPYLHYASLPTCIPLTYFNCNIYCHTHSRPVLQNERKLWFHENYTTQSKVLPCVPWLHTWSNKYTPITHDCEDAVHNTLFHTPKNHSIFLLVRDIPHHRLQITVLHIAFMFVTSYDEFIKHNEVNVVCRRFHPPLSDAEYSSRNCEINHLILTACKRNTYGMVYTALWVNYHKLQRIYFFKVWHLRCVQTTKNECSQQNTQRLSVHDICLYRLLQISHYHAVHHNFKRKLFT